MTQDEARRAEKGVLRVAAGGVIWRILPVVLIGQLLISTSTSGIWAVSRRFKFYDVGFTPFLVLIFLSVPLSLILVRFGARFWLASIAACVGLMVIALGVMFGDELFHFVRTASSLLSVIYFPGALVLFSSWFRLENRAWIIAALLVSRQPSDLVWSTILDRSRLLDGLGGFPDWRWALIVVGGLLVVSSLWALIALRDRPGSAAWLEPEQRKLAEQALDDEPRWRRGTSVWGAIFNRGTLVLVFIQACLTLGSYEAARLHGGATKDSVGVWLIWAVYLSNLAFLYYANPGRNLVPLFSASCFVAVAGSGIAANSASSVITVLGYASILGLGAARATFWSIITRLGSSAAAAGLYTLVHVVVPQTASFIIPWLPTMTVQDHMILAVSLLAAAGIVIWVFPDPARAHNPTHTDSDVDPFLVQSAPRRQPARAFEATDAATLATALREWTARHPR